MTRTSSADLEALEALARKAALERNRAAQLFLRALLILAKGPR